MFALVICKARLAGELAVTGQGQNVRQADRTSCASKQVYLDQQHLTTMTTAEQVSYLRMSDGLMFTVQLFQSFYKFPE